MILEERALPEGTQGNTRAKEGGMGGWAVDPQARLQPETKCLGTQWVGPKAPAKDFLTVSSEPQEWGRLENELGMTLNLGIISQVVPS